jgi:5'-nucleotidase
LSVWLIKYNRDYNDNLTLNNITDWNIDQFTKPECGKKIYQYIENPDIYDTVMPILGATTVVRRIRDLGYRIVYVTHSTKGHAGRKFDWLTEYEMISNSDDYIECKDKSLVKTHYLVDDYPVNIASFSGIGVLFNQPYNRKSLHSPRVNDWGEVYKFFEKELSKNDR